LVGTAAPLLRLLSWLKAREYRFTAITPASHARVLERPLSGAVSLRDIFGWNRMFDCAEIEPELLDIMRAADLIEGTDDSSRSRLRVASLGDDLFLHSSFPTEDAEAVFFGPDTYRFAEFIRDQAGALPSAPAALLDMGAGSGAGGIFAARLLPDTAITLVDINPQALRLAAFNAAFAGVPAICRSSGVVPTGQDLIIANPPYMIDAGQRAYRDGGDLYGGKVALDWTRQALQALNPGGTLLLYTGACVVDGETPLIEALAQLGADQHAMLSVRERDPDVFGEELSNPAYADVERIAVLEIVLRKA
jgi:methylase of polypeptide subunit release factors